MRDLFFWIGMILCALINVLFAGEPSSHSYREQTLLTRTTPSWTNRVNVVTGEFYDHEVDLEVPGAQPITLHRFYHHLAPKDPRQGGWYYNPETFCCANLEWEAQPRFFSIGSEEGSIHCLEHVAPGTYRFNPSQPCFFHTTSGATHPSNLHMFYTKSIDPKNKERFCLQGEVIDGRGSVRLFTSGMHNWNTPLTIKSWDFLRPVIHIWPQEIWTPYQLRIEEERCPNGNRICYSYRNLEPDKPYPIPALLESITAYNHDKSCKLGEIRLSYQRKVSTFHEQEVVWVKSICAQSDGGRHVALIHEEKGGKTLQQVTREGQLPLNYRYDKEGRLTLIQEPNERYTQIYYDASGRVAKLMGPGSVVLSQYHYDTTKTTVHDAEGQKTIYHYDAFKRICTIETFDTQGARFRLERLTWEGQSGQLSSRTLFSGDEKPLQKTTYRYDTSHNLIEEECEGRVHQRLFSQDGRHLLVKETLPSGLSLHYTYLPQTNLITRILMYAEGKIVKRIFRTYDSCALMLREVVDDGEEENEENLSHVHTRHITEITPKKELPCFGLPLTIAYKTLDANKKEVLLSKKGFIYSSTGEVLEEKIYDANDSLTATWKHLYRDGLKIATTDPLGDETRWTYDSNRNCILEEGPLPGKYTETRYDLFNRPILILKNDTCVEERHYDRLGRLIASTNACGQTTTYRYDPLGNLIEKREAEGNVHQWRYNALGALVWEMTERGDQTYWIRNGQGQPLLQRHPDGSEEHITYLPSGLRATHTQAGLLTTYTYDIWGNEIQKTLSYQGETLKADHANYSPFTLLSKIDPSGMTTEYRYDYAGRKYEERCGTQVTCWTYDASGRQATQSDGEVIVKWHYDALGRLLSERKESLFGSLLEEKKQRYNAEGQLIETEDVQGKDLLFYDKRGRLIKRTNRLGESTSFTYTENTQLCIEEKRPDGLRIRTTYNAQQLPLIITWINTDNKPLHITEYQYDPSGNALTKQDKVHRDSTYAYTVTTQWERGPGGRVEAEIRGGIQRDSYHYDAYGRLSDWTRPNGITLHHVYDALGRVIRFYGPDFDYHTFYDAADRPTESYDSFSKTTTLRTYDQQGNLCSERLANGLQMTYHYDTYGRRILAHFPSLDPIHYTYLHGKLFQVAVQDLTFTYASRDLQGRATHLILPKKLGQISAQRDALGRLTTLISPLDTLLLSYRAALLTKATWKGEGDAKYAYDALGQLIEENEDSYSFDSIGNTEECSSLCQSKYATYDANGNLLSEGNRRYFYDALDRLIRVVTPEGEATYSYDAFHRRIASTLRGKTLRYLWDGSHEVGCPELQEMRILSEGITNEMGNTLLIFLGTRPYLPLHDFRGNLCALINLETKVTQGIYRYSAFGVEEKGVADVPWRFCGKRVDALTHLVYFGRRFYSPSLGRWLTPDPLGSKAGANPYLFVLNNPLTFLDPHGLLPHNAAEFIAWCFKPAFYTLEMTGKHLIPLPGIRDLVESIGRWGLGGSFNEPCSYQRNYDRIHTITGYKIPHQTITYKNGILTTFEQAVNAAQNISNLHDKAEVVLLYNGTHGLIMDLLESCIAKLGIPTPVEHMSANFYRDLLRKDPHNRIISYAHSQGGSHMMNVARYLTPCQRSRINLYTFGSSTLIPEGTFGYVQNYLSLFDPIPLLSFSSYCGALFSEKRHITFLRPHSFFPWKEHFVSEATYWIQLARIASNI